MKTFLIFIFICFTLSAYSQCGLEISSRENGKIVYGTIPKMLGNINNGISVGISYQKIDELDFVALLIRSRKENLKDELKLTLENNKIIVGKLVKSTNGSLNTSDYTLGIYLVTKSDFNNLGESNLNKINFSYLSNSSDEIIVTSNADCLKSVIACLNANSIIKSSASNTLETEKLSSEILSKLDELDNKNGFRELQFGKEIDEIKEYKFGMKNVVNGEESYYILDKNMKIFDSPINYIKCSFLFGKLARIEIDNSTGSTVGVIDLLKENFGEPRTSNYGIGDRRSKEYLWEGKEVELLCNTYVDFKIDNLNINKLYSSGCTLIYKIKNYSAIQEEAKKQFLISKKRDL